MIDSSDTRACARARSSGMVMAISRSKRPVVMVVHRWKAACLRSERVILVILINFLTVTLFLSIAFLGLNLNAQKQIQLSDLLNLFFAKAVGSKFELRQFFVIFFLKNSPPKN